MKKIILSIATLMCFTAYSSFAQTGDANFKQYGISFEAQSVLSPGRVHAVMKDQKELKNFQMTGFVSEVCQKEGCWLKLNSNQQSNENMMVKMKDHAFLLPKDIAGKRILVHGTVSKKEISVSEQQHYLEAAGASKEEISKITAPKEEFVMIADGVRIYE